MEKEPRGVAGIERLVGELTYNNIVKMHYVLIGCCQRIQYFKKKNKLENLNHAACS